MAPQAQSVVDTITRCCSPLYRNIAAADINRCFDNDTYSDLTIKCRERSWKVHRVIVCSQSKVLHAACMAGFKEQYTGIIELDDDDPVPVEIMLKYFYTGKYNEPATNKEPTNKIEELRSPLQIQALTYNLADKYDIPNLMGLAGKRFRSTLSEDPTPEEYLSVVSDVYTIPTSTNVLRAIAAEYARVRFRDMMQSSVLETLRATLQDVPEFAFDVLQLFANAPLTGHCHSCGPNQSAEALQARCMNCGKGGISLIHY